MKQLKINYTKLDEGAKAPYKRFDIDAGFDLTAIWKKETEKYVEYGTGLAFEIPAGYVGLLFPRSSVRDQDLVLKNCVGVLDASYRGEVKFSFANHIHGKILINEEMDRYEIGDRVGQIVFIELPQVKLDEVAKLSETDRGTAGYGSSGK